MRFCDLVNSNSKDDLSYVLFCRLAPPDAPTYRHRLMLSAPPHMVYIVLSNHMWFLLLHMCLHTSWHMFQPGHVTAGTCYTSLHMYQPTHVTADTCYTSQHMLYQWTHVTAHTCSSQHMCKSGNHMWLNRPYKLEVVMQRTSVCGGMSPMSPRNLSSVTSLISLSSSWTFRIGHH